MPFAIIKANSRARFSEVLFNLANLESLEPDVLIEVPQEVKIQKGLYYVHLYAALEKSVNEVVEQAILLIKNEQVKNNKYNTHFNVISLHSKMKSFKECSYKSYFKKSIDVFKSIESEECFEISNTLFSHNLQNIWFDTIQEVLISFGIPALVVDPRVQFTVNEIVDKRNAVAHGRESALFIGERHRMDILRLKTNDIQLVIDMFIDSFESYILNHEYLKENSRIASTQ